MSRAANVVPLNRDLSSREEDDSTPPPNVLGVLHRKDFELWICRGAAGALTLKWWRWRSDLERFLPLEEGELSLNPGDLQDLASMLVAVDERLHKQNRK